MPSNTIGTAGGGVQMRSGFATEATLPLPRSDTGRGVSIAIFPPILRIRGFAGKLRCGLEAIRGLVLAFWVVVGRVAYPDVFEGVVGRLIKFRRRP